MFGDPCQTCLHGLRQAGMTTTMVSVRPVTPEPWRHGSTMQATAGSTRGVGGDVQGFIELSGGHLGVAIGDVSGKASSAADGRRARLAAW